MHTKITLTVKRKYETDYYGFEYNNEYYTYTIAWGRLFRYMRFALNGKVIRFIIGAYFIVP